MAFHRHPGFQTIRAGKATNHAVGAWLPHPTTEYFRPLTKPHQSFLVPNSSQELSSTLRKTFSTRYLIRIQTPSQPLKLMKPQETMSHGENFVNGYVNAPLP